MNNAIKKMDWKTYNNSIPIFKEERFSNEIERIDKLNIDNVCSKDFIEYWKPYLDKIPYEWSFHPHIVIPDEWELCSPFYKSMGVPSKKDLNNAKGLHLVNTALRRYEKFYEVFNNKKSKYNAVSYAFFNVEKVWKTDYLYKFLLHSNNEVLSLKQKWDLIEEIWSIIEFPYKQEQDRELWNEIFYNINRPMCIVNEFPVDKEYTVYRGGHPEGISWTTSKECATWFYQRWNSHKYNPNYKLSKKTVKGKDVLFSSNGRGEYELVLHPRTLEMKYTEVEPSSPELVSKWRGEKGMY